MDIIKSFTNLSEIPFGFDFWNDAVLSQTKYRCELRAASGKDSERDFIFV